MADAAIATKRTLVFEDGKSGRFFYSNDPRDPGGETVHGVARKMNPEWAGWAIVDQFRNDPNFPNVLLGNQQLNDAVVGYYHNDQWAAVKGDDLTSQKMANHLFDAAVNMGSGDVQKTGEIGAAHLAQSAYNAVATDAMTRLVEDGAFGPVSVSGLNLLMENGLEQSFVDKFCELRKAEYDHRIALFPHLEIFRNTWYSRCDPTT